MKLLLDAGWRSLPSDLSECSSVVLCRRSIPLFLGGIVRWGAENPD